MPKLQTTAQIDCVVQTIMTVQCTSSYADYSGLLVSVDFYSKNHPWRESSLRPIRYSGGEDSRTIVLRSPYVPRGSWFLAVQHRGTSTVTVGHTARYSSTSTHLAALVGSRVALVGTTLPVCGHSHSCWAAAAAARQPASKPLSQPCNGQRPRGARPIVLPARPAAPVPTGRS
jgi:hypothetical protein